MKPVRPAHGGNIIWAAQRYGRSSENFLDFSANINPLGMPPSIKEALLANITTVALYPDPAGSGLKNTLSTLLQQPTRNIVLGNGAADLIYRCLALWRPKRIIVLAPSFSEYERAARNLEIPVIRTYLRPQNCFALPVAKLAEKIQSGDLLFLANPNNPTGNLFAREDMLTLLRTTEQTAAYLVVDESFLPFLSTYPENALLWQKQPGPRILTITSLTKYLAIPGLRLAFGVAGQPTILGLEKHSPPWNINALALLAGQVGLADREFQDETRRFVCEEKSFLANQLRKLRGVQPYNTEVNFVLVNVAASHYLAPTLEDRLGHRGILIRNCSNFPGLSMNYIRLAVRTRGENEQLLSALKELIGEA